MQCEFSTKFCTHQINSIDFAIMVISDYYNLLPSNDSKNAFRDAVMKELGIAYTTFYQKLRNGSWRKPEEVVVLAIIERDKKNA